MKKKTISLCLVSAMAVTAIAGTSLAYFTDTDKADNVFTAGKVDIKLIEQQRNSDGTALESFENGKMLFPVVGSVQNDKDSFGLSTAANYTDKIITVENLQEDAYVRVFVAIPSELDNIEDDSMDILHFDEGQTFVAEGNKNDIRSLNDDAENWSDKTFEGTGYIENEEYNVYSYTYGKRMGKETTGSACIVGFYLDKDVDFNGQKYTVTRDGQTTEIDTDLSSVTIPVFAQGIQAEGFSSAAEAFEASGLTTNPWAD